MGGKGRYMRGKNMETRTGRRNGMLRAGGEIEGEEKAEESRYQGWMSKVGKTRE